MRINNTSIYYVYTTVLYWARYQWLCHVSCEMWKHVLCEMWNFTVIFHAKVIQLHEKLIQWSRKAVYFYVENAYVIWDLTKMIQLSVSQLSRANCTGEKQNSNKRNSNCKLINEWILFPKKKFFMLHAL